MVNHKTEQGFINEPQNPELIPKETAEASGDDEKKRLIGGVAILKSDFDNQIAEVGTPEWRQQRKFAIQELNKCYSKDLDVQKIVLTHPNNNRGSDITYKGTAENYDLLSLEQEKELFGFINKGVESFIVNSEHTTVSTEAEQDFKNLVAANQLLYRCNIRLVQKIANSAKTVSMDFDDLVQEGLIALDGAIKTFDSTRNIKFSTFATVCIKRGLNRAINYQEKSVKIPEDVINRTTDFKIKLANLTKQLGGQKPTVQQIASYMSLSEDRASKGLDELSYLKSLEPVSLELPLYDNNDATLFEVLANKPTDAEQENYDWLKDLMAKRLTEEERLIVGLRFVLPPKYVSEGESLTINDRLVDYNEIVKNLDKKLAYYKIGKLIGKVDTKVRQIESAALAKIQSKQSASK